MSRAVMVLTLAMWLAGGCATYEGSRKTAATGGVMMLVGLVGLGAAAASLDRSGGAPQSGAAGVVGIAGFGAALIGAYVGIPLAIGGLIGMGIYDKPTAAPP